MVDHTRVAWDPTASTLYQPSVGRFGLFPPPPLAHGAIAPSDCDTKPAGDSNQAAAATKPGEPGDSQHQPGHVIEHPPMLDCRSWLSEYSSGDFSGDPIYDHLPWNACDDLGVYGNKSQVPTQRPWVEWPYPFYGAGELPPPGDQWWPTNPTQPRLFVYGDYRIGVAQNRNIAEETTVLAHRLNLDVDLWLTSTERVHMFLNPFQENGRFMRIEEGKFFNEFDLFDDGADTLFFEGDLGYMLSGFEHRYSEADIPFTVGLIPLLFQNGIWMQDAMWGAAFTLPARNNARFDWSNYDITFFAAFDNVSTLAQPADEDAARLLGAITFIEARGGYFELGYAYVDDTDSRGRSYHNLGVSYTRRYFNRVSNSLRAIVNAGQSGPEHLRTADGLLLLCENSLITENPYNVIPYCNFFAGFGRPQPAARAAAFGDVLFNTGILFQVDGLTGYPTLDATGNDTFGAALGVDLLGENFDQQLIVEAAALQVIGSDPNRNASGDQYGVGARYQVPITNAHLLRFDAMHGWLDGDRNISGVRGEFRWKF
jgi:hypothetical protein